MTIQNLAILRSCILLAHGSSPEKIPVNAGHYPFSIHEHSVIRLGKNTQLLLRRCI